MDPFTNQPYNFEGTAVDPHEVEFNNGIREITVCVEMSTCITF